MLKPGSLEWKRKIASMLAEEAKQPLGGYYLSFAEPGKFLGGVYLEAHGPTSALRLTHELGINPGGEVMTYSVPLELMRQKIPVDMRNRLLTKQEVESAPAS